MSRAKPTDQPQAGRPPRAGRPSTARIEVRVTPEEYALYTAAARREGKTLTDVVRAYLRRWAK